MLVFALFSSLCLSVLLGTGYFYIKRLKGRLKQQVSHELAIKQWQEKEQQWQKEHRTLQHKLRVAIEDPVTELLGFQLFTDRLNQSIHESRRYQFSIAILFIDIDQFRTINEALGPQTGDAVLLEAAKRLRACIRQVDSITRWVKDTFVVLLTQLHKPETAAVVAQRMLQSLLPPFLLADHHAVQVSACIGIALFPTDGKEAGELLRNAEHALSAAKAKGSQVYQFYQEKIHVDSARELGVLTKLKGEFVASEFEAYYQPIMDVQRNTVFCLDARMYWHHPEFGLIGPQELSQYTEKLGKATAFTEWLLQHACRHFHAQVSKGPGPYQACSWRLGLPLTFSQLNNENFIYRLSHVLQEMHFKPECLLLEIQTGQGHWPSSLVLDNMEKIFNMLTYLKVQLAVEYSGHNPFALLDLQKMPLQYLKLSQSLLYQGDDSRTTALIKAVVALADSLGLQLIIQDIESARQVEVFKSLDCHLLQGPFIGPSLPAEHTSAKPNMLYS